MIILPSSLRIGVLRGGPSPEYDVSLKTGGNILNILSKTHKPADIFISQDGIWHINGIERSPDRILKSLDVVWNGLHGTYGEDGGVQELLDSMGTRYTGSERFPSAISMNKWLTKEKLKSHGIKTPLAFIVRREDNLTEKVKEIFGSFSFPIMVKPACGGSSIGVYIARNLTDLVSSIEATLENHGSALIEEYISGREATCGVVSNFRGQDIYALPIVEIKSSNNFFDNDSKYNGKSEEICPGNFSLSEKREIENISKTIHDKLGLRHYSRSDFIVSPRRGIYFLEVNSLPGMTNESLMPKSLEAVGISTKEFVHHILNLALQNS
jgi:D-alanine-D-alanine ligase